MYSIQTALYLRIFNQASPQIASNNTNTQPTTTATTTTTISYSENMIIPPQAEGEQSALVEHGADIDPILAAIHPNPDIPTIRHVLLSQLSCPTELLPLILATNTNRLDLIDFLFLHFAHPTCHGNDPWPLEYLITRHLNHTGKINPANKWSVIDWRIFLRFLEAGQQAEMLESIPVHLVAILFSQVIAACKRRKNLRALLTCFAQMFVGGAGTLKLTQHEAYTSIWSREVDVARVLRARNILMRITQQDVEVSRRRHPLVRKPITGRLDSKRRAVLDLNF